MTDLPMSFLLCGPPKSGKTRLGATTPEPRLIVDLEGRARYGPEGKGAVFWDGSEEPLKLAKSSTRTYILQTKKLNVIDQAQQWLRSGKHPWKSFTLDSTMELKYMVKQAQFPGAVEPNRTQRGGINIVYENYLRVFRDILDDPANPLKCGVFITGASYDSDSERIRPILQGVIGEMIPYWMDIVGYLEAVTMKGVTEPVRKLHLKQRKENDLEVGDGTDRIVTKLGSPIDSPNITSMWDALQAEETG